MFPPPFDPSDAQCVVLSFTLHFALAVGLVDLTSGKWVSRGERKAGSARHPLWRRLAEFRLDTSSLCSSCSNASEKVQAASQSRGGPWLAVLVLAPMRCLKPVPSGFAAGRSPLCVHISSPSQTAGALHLCPLGLLPIGWGSGHGCIPCWRTSHPTADLKRS